MKWYEYLYPIGFVCSWFIFILSLSVSINEMFMNLETSELGYHILKSQYYRSDSDIRDSIKLAFSDNIITEREYRNIQAKIDSKTVKVTAKNEFEKMIKEN